MAAAGSRCAGADRGGARRGSQRSLCQARYLAGILR